MVNVELFKVPVMAPYIITQTYQEHLDYAKEHPETSYNGGIDLYSDDLAVRAAFDGIVEKVAYQAGGYGNYVRLLHHWGYTLYAHLDRVCCNLDNRVTAGMKIGEMGNTGFSTGRHLHFEMRDLNEKVLDPTEFFVSEPINAHSPLSVISAPAGGNLTIGIGRQRFGKVISAPAGGNLRKDPMGEKITTIPAGTVVKVIDGPVYRYGLACYEIEAPVRGWMAEADHYGTKILSDYGE